MFEGPLTADFWFDPSCPYTWLTSRWMLEAQRVRPVTVRWRVMSLAVLNEGRQDNPEGEWGDFLWRPVRICAAVAEEFGEEALGRLFTALGARLHERGEWDTAGAALAEAGLPARLASAADSPGWDPAVRASHAEAMALVGPEVGTPVIAVGGERGGRAAFFGPVVAPVPRGEQAGRLWDGVLLLAGEPGFHELKRSRPEQPPTG
ncbi:mycothiol-dependent nitroreductase Rv2466c family protein [Streptomyces johnsoniae]|uniref:Disulfide bond formation protein DsbA n=1 Tax=Streptomyces johnsoniae TaxID=3075532 RepID=A0ABU2S6K1_9ACTN|nr:disulfide bond formation protein DsbA [Streptomyces sp. DSM 41886]MDT0444609.1 disulfide bond formation protein DsbA [Streptomyces sp. DSM 41886]